MLLMPQPSKSQTISPSLIAQSDELAEAERLKQQVIELENQSKFKEAIPLAERALAIREKALGPDRVGTSEKPAPEEALQPLRRSSLGGSGLAEGRRTRRSSESSAMGDPLVRNSGSGAGGNSDAFNPDRDGPGEGIDAAQDVDFGPYMAELQRRVKGNWVPPEQGNPRRSVLRFRISRNGEISNLRVGKTSGNPDTDAAAMNAVCRAAPFRALPAAYKQQYIAIQFTFDININGINVDGIKADGIKADGEDKRPTEPAIDRPAYNHSKSYKSPD